jgi:hypothetical protein
MKLLFAAVHRSLLALSGQNDGTGFCRLLDQQRTKGSAGG